MEKKEKKSFWQSIPGMLTGIASLITAVGGIYFGIISQNGDSPSNPQRNPSMANTSIEEDASMNDLSPLSVSFEHETIISSDDFLNNENGWYTGSINNNYQVSNREIKEGRYYWELSLKPPEMIYTWVYSRFPSVTDFNISLDIGFENIEGNPTAGIIFGFNDDNNYYMFEVSKFDTYSLTRLKNGESITKIEWANAGIINQDEFNLAISVIENEASLFIDENFIGKIKLDDYQGGLITIALNNYEEGTLIAWFDNFILSSLMNPS